MRWSGGWRRGLACGLIFYGGMGTLHAAAPDAVQTARHELLRVGDDRRADSAALALRRYQAAQLIQKDPENDYAYALVLLRLTKNKEAVPILAQATRARHVSAVQAEVALLLAQKQWTVAAERMERVAGWLNDGQPLLPANADRTQLTEWLGRAVSTGQLISTQATDVQRFQKVDQAIRAKLTDADRAAYSNGFDAVITLEEQLATTADDVEKTATARLEAEREAEKLRLKNEQTQTQGNRENLKLTAEEWKKTLDGKLADFAKQLGLLEKEWNGLDQRRQSLERSITLAQNEQQILSNQAKQIRRDADGDRLSAFDQRQLAQIDQELLRREQQIFGYQQDRNQTLTTMNQQYQQALGVIQQRQVLVNDYEKATGQLVQKDESLKKWNDRLQKKEKTLSEPPKGKPAAVAAIDQKRKTVSTFLPTDWEGERQRLLAETAE